MHAPGPLALSTLPEFVSARVAVQTAHEMLKAGPRCLPISPFISPPTFPAPYSRMSAHCSRSHVQRLPCTAWAARGVPHRTLPKAALSRRSPLHTANHHKRSRRLTPPSHWGSATGGKAESALRGHLCVESVPAITKPSLSTDGTNQ